jgi:hypothetical protein
MGEPADGFREAKVGGGITIPNTINNARVGFYSSLAYAFLLTALNVSFVIMALQVPAVAWQGMEAYARTYRTIAFIPQAIGLLSIPALILMLASLHSYARESHKPWSLAGFAFGTAHAALLGSLYFIQVAILLPALKRGTWQGLEQYAFANPRSIAWGLDHFAWSLLGIALLLMAWIFEGDALRRWIRRSLLLNGLANLSLIFAFALEIEALTLAVAFSSWMIGLPLAALLVALMFRNILRADGLDPTPPTEGP